MPVLATDAQEVTAPIEVLKAWLSRPETIQRMQAAVSEAITETERHIVNDTPLHVPRQKSERQGGFQPWLDAYGAGLDQWLKEYKIRLAEQIQNEVVNTFSGEFTLVQNKNTIRETVESLVWPQLESLLRQRAVTLLMTYAIRGIVLPWVSRHLGDGLLLGIPEARNEEWHVPLHDRITQKGVAEVVLDRDGEVLSDIGALRTALQLHQ